MRPALGALLLLVLVVGCIGPVKDPHQFGGTFTEQATPAQMEDFRARMEAHGAQDVLLLESFPVQFSVEQVPGATCAAARQEADALPYVQEAGPCRPSGGS